MPRQAASGTHPDWNGLYQVAASQAGYFTADDASEVGFSLPLLQYHIDSGRVERSQRGVFRLVNFPPTDQEGFVPAWLWSRREGTFSHETALALHQLSDALPAKLHLTVPLRWRKRRIQIPHGLILYYADLDTSECEWKGPVRVTTPLRTVVDCSAHRVAHDLIEQAVRQGVRRHYFTRTGLKQGIRRSLDERGHSGTG